MARRGLRSLFAPVVMSATPVTAKRPEGRSNPTPGATPGRRQPWQTQAYSYYDQLGELWFAAQFYGRMLSKLRIYVAKQDAGGDWIEEDAGPGVDAWKRVQDPGGGRSKIQRRYGQQMFLAGECYLFVSWPNGVETWEMLSTDELRFRDKKWERRMTPGAQGSNAGVVMYTEPEQGVPTDASQGKNGEGYGWRMWRDHPQYSDIADGPVRGVLLVMDELLILTKGIRAQALSKVSRAGILFMPDDGLATPDSAVSNDDAQEDPFVAELGEHMMEPIADSGAASAVVPMVVRMAGESIAQVKLQTFGVDAKNYPEADLRDEAIRRIALGLDMPPEILLGKGDVNHWGAWEIDEDAWKTHGEPIAEMMVADLTTAFLQPIVNDAAYALRFDAASVVSKPNRSSDAKDLYDRGLIKGDVVRDVNGWAEKDAMDEAEYDRWVGVQLQDASLATGGPITEPGGATSDPGVTDAGDDGANVDKTPPDASVASMLTAADFMVTRCREQAGARLRGALQRLPQFSAAAAERRVPNGEFAAYVGQVALDALGRDSDSLVAGACLGYVETLERRGVHPDVARQLVTECEAHAAATLLAKDATLPNDIIARCSLAAMLSEP